MLIAFIYEVIDSNLYNAQEQNSIAQLCTRKSPEKFLYELFKIFFCVRCKIVFFLSSDLENNQIVNDTKLAEIN